MIPHCLRNASGPARSAEQVTTARDLSVLGRAIQDRFPKYYTYFRPASFNYAGVQHPQPQPASRQASRASTASRPVTSALSGFNILTNVKTDSRHVVAVVLGGRSGASRDNTMASLIGDNLPRAYAGARIAPPVGEGTAARSWWPTRLRLAVRSRVQSARRARRSPRPPPAPPARKPLDLNTLRPVVASAAGASGTTTPSSGVRWQKGAQPLPLNAQAYAALQEADEISETQKLPSAQDRSPGSAVASSRAPAVKTASLDRRREGRAGGNRTGREDRDRLGDPARRNGRRGARPRPCSSAEPPARSPQGLALYRKGNG